MEPHRAVKICVYNYKGGASKTTITVNLAAALADKGKKVLMVDLDPQCNTTQFWHPDDVKNRDASESEQEVEEAAYDLLEMNGNSTEIPLLCDKLHPSRENSSMEAFVSKFKKTPLHEMLSAHFDASELDDVNEILDAEDTVIPVNDDFFKGRLHLLAGSQLLFRFERSITQALEDPTLPDKHVKSIGIMNYMLNRLAEKHKFDVIILDLSPSNSALNQISALSCDYILPPCNASLYSCGSVYGLLETVLPGDDGWFGFHTRLSNKHWDGVWEKSTIGQRLLPFRLPREPPQLLPILVNNYGLQASAELFASALGNKRRKMEEPVGETVKHVYFQPSQFVYTLMGYLQDCKEIERSPARGTSAPAQSSKIKFRSNRGREVIPFCPSVPVSIAATEALGRPFVEITLNDFSSFYKLDPGECDQARHQFIRKSKLLKDLMRKGALDSLDINANDVFEREVELVKNRYLCLATWLIDSVFPAQAQVALPAQAQVAPPPQAAAAIDDID